MIAQTASSTTESHFEEELVALRSKLDEALFRIGNLEAQAALNSERSALFPIDAPAMQFARQLCAEIFPGPLSIEVACAPDDPSARWYVFLLRCAADIQVSIDLELEFGRRLVDAFPEEAGDIRLVVSLQ